MSLRKGKQVIAGTPNITTGHHVGEIFWTSRLDNELNGAVDADGAVYSVEAFTGEHSVPELLRKGSLPSVSMAEYESVVSTYGSCRAWGYDGGDTFRVPTLKDVYLMAGQAESAGEFISESLPNHNHIEGFAGVNATSSYGVTNASVAGNINQQSGTNTANHPFTSKASESSSIYQDGAKVRPDSVRYRAMVQLSTGVKEDATQLKEYKFNNPHFFGQSMWTGVDPKNGSWLLSNGAYHSGRTYGDYYKWLTDIKSGNKTVEGVSVKSVDDEYTDYDWVVNTADTTFRLPLLNGEESLPSDRYNDLTIESADSTYTAPANGWFKVSAQGWTSFEMNNTTAGGIGAVFDLRQDNFGRSTVEAKKGQEIKLAYSGTITNANFRFVYATGNGSLYFYVGDTLQDPALINAGGVLSDVAELKGADFDQSAKEKIVGWGIPDYSAGITITNGYIADRKGLATVSMDGSNHVTSSVYINGIKIGHSSAGNQYQESSVNAQISLDLGDKISWEGTQQVIAMFFPYKGV